MKTNAQGEILICKIDKLPQGLVKSSVEREQNGDWIISHSEQGNHHVIDAHATVLERPDSGMSVLYAILDEPGELKQNASDAHEKHNLGTGIYEMRIKRERRPFSEQIERVRD